MRGGGGGQCGDVGADGGPETLGEVPCRPRGGRGRRCLGVVLSGEGLGVKAAGAGQRVATGGRVWWGGDRRGGVDAVGQVGEGLGGAAGGAGRFLGRCLRAVRAERGMRPITLSAMTCLHVAPLVSWSGQVQPAWRLTEATEYRVPARGPSRARSTQTVTPRGCAGIGLSE